MHSYENRINRMDCRCDMSTYKQCVEPSASGLIDDIMKKYFCQTEGQGSSCSLFSIPKGSIYSMDRRLEYWEQVLEDRKKIACRIKKTTGKRFSHVLFNQLDVHTKVQNIKRILDYAERLDPTKLAMRRSTHLRDPQIFETIPLPERQQYADLEIFGIPKLSRVEQFIRPCHVDNNRFLTSKILQKKLKSKIANASKVLGFYPEIDCLQVVGQRIHKHTKSSLSQTSSVSQIEKPKKFNTPEFCIVINNQQLQPSISLTDSIIFRLNFKCKPFESPNQTICEIKNIGRTPVELKWKKLRPKGAAFLPPEQHVFYIKPDTLLISNEEAKSFEVSFEPTERIIQQEQWWLRTNPHFFKESEQIVHLHLTGECYIPDDYFRSIIWDMLDSIISRVIPETKCDIRNRLAMKFFERLNPGIKCQLRYLQELNEVYEKVRDSSSPPEWNLSLHTLKKTILEIRDFRKRPIYMDIVMKIIRAMKPMISDCDSNVKALLARDLFILAFDDWNVKAEQVIKEISQSDADAVLIKMPFDFVIDEFIQCNTVQEKRIVLQHHALFIHMYCSLCNLAEDLVLFIENSLS